MVRAEPDSTNLCVGELQDRRSANPNRCYNNRWWGRMHTSAIIHAETVSQTVNKYNIKEQTHFRIFTTHYTMNISENPDFPHKGKNSPKQNRNKPWPITRMKRCWQRWNAAWWRGKKSRAAPPSERRLLETLTSDRWSTKTGVQWTHNNSRLVIRSEPSSAQLMVAAAPDDDDDGGAWDYLHSAGTKTCRSAEESPERLNGWGGYHQRKDTQP